MIHLKLRQAGLLVNYKRAERAVSRGEAAGTAPQAQGAVVVRASAANPGTYANQVWSMDFVFDRAAKGRGIKCLTIVDDATHVAVAIEVERAISGLGMTRVIDRMALARGLPQMIRTDTGKEFCDKAMVTWAHEHGVQLRQIQPGKPNKNAYVESFNGRLRKSSQKLSCSNAAR